VINLKEELDRLFTFQRNVSDAYRKLEQHYNSIQNVRFTNIKISSDQYPVTGIAQHLHEDNEGAIIYEYVVDKNMRKNGPCFEGNLALLQDCEYHYYGLKLNCLAEIYGKRIKSLVIQDCYNNVTYPVRRNPTIAKLFLYHIVGTRSKQYILPDIAKHQINLFAA
jgi:hypothetical protein